MVKPYIRRFCRTGRFDVWLVDGAYIRRNIDEEFTNFGQHYAYGYIPEHEFWIDFGECPGEENYFIDHLLVENRLMAEGKSYNYARARGKIAEKRERLKSGLMKKLRKITDRSRLLGKIHERLLRDGRVKVWLVRGIIVRDLHYLDFTEGGHGYVYPFIPRSEVWIDDDVRPSERDLVLLHELHERNLMSLRKKDYLSAHASASSLECRCRYDKELLAKKIALEFRKAEKG